MLNSGIKIQYIKSLFDSSITNNLAKKLNLKVQELKLISKFNDLKLYIKNSLVHINGNKNVMVVLIWFYLQLELIIDKI